MEIVSGPATPPGPVAPQAIRSDARAMLALGASKGRRGTRDSRLSERPRHRGNGSGYGQTRRSKARYRTLLALMGPILRSLPIGDRTSHSTDGSAPIAPTN